MMISGKLFQWFITGGKKEIWIYQFLELVATWNCKLHDDCVSGLFKCWYDLKNLDWLKQYDQSFCTIDRAGVGTYVCCSRLGHCNSLIICITPALFE